MADADVQIAPDGTGKLIDTGTVTTAAGTVHRQRVSIGDQATGSAVADVDNAFPALSEYGLVTRPLSANLMKHVNANPSSVVVNASATFSQASMDMTDLSAGAASYSKWRCLVAVDQAGTLAMQQSPDNSSWYTTIAQSVVGGTPLIEESLIVMRYLRAQFTCGAVGTTVFVFRVALVGV